MHEMIEFPNLGIHLESVGHHITVFGFEIAYYGIIIGIGILVGIAIAMAEAKRTGQCPDDYIDLAIYGVIFSIIGARIYYVAFSWDMYKDNLKSIFNIREGGLAIYGGVIAAIITVIIFAKIKHLSAPLLFDTAGLGLVAGQMIGRWGNFFNREAFGEYTNNLLAMRIPINAVRSSDVTEMMRNNSDVVEGIRCIQVHPTFLYESLWCLMVLIIMLIYRKHKKFNGEVFLIYLLGYGCGRVWIEGLRTDQLLIPGLELPVSQILAGTIIVVSLLMIIIMRWKVAKQNKRSV
ncbi:MAG: prolipoprotein diacylglyceryl transferase [Dorea sp.]